MMKRKLGYRFRNSRIYRIFIAAIGRPVGEFWGALSDDRVIGTIGLMMQKKHCAVLKKFFEKKEFRSQKVGRALYQELFRFARGAGVRQIMLDTPSVAHASHRFYEKAAFTEWIRRN